MSSLFRFTQALQPARLSFKTLPFTFSAGRTPNLRHVRFYRPRSPPPPSPSSTSPSSKTIYVKRRDVVYDANLKQYIIYGIIGINVAVFAYGAYAKTEANQGYRGRFNSFIQNMTLNLNEFKYGHRWWTALTSNYTHLDIIHLGCNMFVFYTMGGFLVHVPAVLPGRFLILILGSGLLGSAGHLWHRVQNVGSGGQDRTIGLGFSGALMGVSTVATCYFPKVQMLLMGIVPMPLWVLTGGYVIYDGYFLNDSGSRIGHAGHLGGVAFGALYYLLRLRGLKI